jgi:hypothetical protein
MESGNVLLTIAVIAALVSLIGAGMTYNYMSAFRTKMTGFATSTGWVNLTVEESVAINFTRNTIDWGSGMVTTGQTYALLDTSNQSAANVTNGNWTGNHNGLVIENIGNKNVSLQLKAASDNTTMIGGTSGGAGSLLQWKFSDNDTTTSCTWGDSGAQNNTWRNVNTSGNGNTVCDKFYFEDGRDQIKIDIFVKIPSDSIVGARGNTITATFSAA